MRLPSMSRQMMGSSSQVVDAVAVVPALLLHCLKVELVLHARPGHPVLWHHKQAHHVLGVPVLPRLPEELQPSHLNKMSKL